MQRSETVKSSSLETKSLELVGREESPQNGLAKLVLSLVELLRQVLERQALRRVESGDLSTNEIERLGFAFLEMKSKIETLSREFGIKSQDLLSTFGTLVKSEQGLVDDATLVDVLDRCLKKGVFVGGQVKITVSDIELVGLDLSAILYPISNNKK